VTASDPSFETRHTQNAHLRSVRDVVGSPHRVGDAREAADSARDTQHTQHRQQQLVDAPCQPDDNDVPRINAVPGFSQRLEELLTSRQRAPIPPFLTAHH
jgi:hypothetical protein